jgi:hypothetical protein
MNLSKKLFIILFSFLILMNLSCGNEEKNKTDQPEEMTFQVNQSLLGEKYSDNELGFSFSPPIGCKLMPKNLVQQVKAEITKNLVSPESLALEPKQFFLNKNEQFFCLLTTLPMLVLSDSSIKFYNMAVKNSAAGDEVQSSTYKYNHFLIYQSLIMNDETINFKLLIPQAEHKSFQIDYILPKSIYVNKIEVIESSIGSLSKQL